jgi:DNA replication and repair protein RecF
MEYVLSGCLFCFLTAKVLLKNMITDIRLQAFRSYDDESFEFDSGVNIIVGPNASGKTNLLEAILLLARGSSYRVRDNELLKFGAPWARLDAHDEQENSRVLKLECLSENICKKSFEIDGKPFQRLSAQKSLPVVVFEPNHLLLLSGSPELRRNYLDDLLEQTSPGFAAYRRHYRRVLAQRNALLKKGLSVARPQMFVWNLRLSELAGKIVSERVKLIAAINEIASATYSELAHSSQNVTLKYISNCAIEQYESRILHKLEQNLERDVSLGYTTAGPHRDDVRVLLNGYEAQDTASRGETRTIILTLKIIELRLLADTRGQTPLLLLDDVFSELDGARRQALTSFLQPYQTFITTTDADIVVQHFMDSCRVIPLGSGAD